MAATDIIESLLADVDPEMGLAWPTRFLIVDDAASTRRFIRTVLECCPQFEVAGEADNGSTAVTEAEALQPDVILLDLSMPVSDGAEALVNLQRVVPSAIVVVLSGANRGAAPALLAAGATAFISKGLAPFALLEQLGAILLKHLPTGHEATAGWDECPLVPEPPHASGGRTDTCEQPGVATSAEDEVLWVDPYGHAQVVVCDGDPLSRHLVGQVVSACGVTTVTDADTVPALLSAISLTRPDVVIFDPWLTGSSETSAISEILRRCPETHVLVYTAHDELQGAALEAGAEAFLVKPAFEDLGREVERLLPVPHR